MSTFKCNFCDREFDNARSRTSHQNHHNPEYHARSKAGAISSQKKASTAASLKASTTAKDQYETNKKTCVCCNSEIPYEKRYNKFCSKSCAATFNNTGRVHSDETKNKMSAKTTEYNTTHRVYPERKKREKLGRRKRKYGPPKPSTCTICGSSHLRSGKTCSNECYKKLISKSLSKSFEEGRHKGNLYRSRINPSYMERSFKEWLLTNHPTVNFETEYSVPIYENGTYVRTYYIDFFFPELSLGIELDGTHHQYQKEYDEERDKLIEQRGIRIVRIPHHEYVSGSRIEEIANLIN